MPFLGQLVREVANILMSHIHIVPAFLIDKQLFDIRSTYLQATANMAKEQ